MQRIPQQRARARNKQRGIALVFCLFALILLTFIAMALISMADTETAINRNFRSSQQALFGANAGLEEARSRLTPDLVGGIVAPTLMPGTGAGSVIYIRNPRVVNGALETVDPLDPTNEWYDTELCHENFTGVGFANPGVNIPCAATTPAATGWWTYLDSSAPGHGTSSALNYKWVRINLKVNASNAPFYVDGGGNAATHSTQVCWDGTREVLRPGGYTACDAPVPTYKPVLVITALAQGSRRMTQMEVAQNPPINVEGAVASYDHVTLNGALSVNGYDNCSCMKSTDASGKTIYISRPGKTCDASKWAIYSHSTIDSLSGKSETAVAGPTPPTAQNMPWNHDVEALVDSFKKSSLTKDVTKAPYNWSCTGSPPNCGIHTSAAFGVPPTFPPSPPDNPVGPANMAMQYTYVPGDLKITAASVGNGVLIVDGDLEIQGGLEFYGLILVKGVVKFTGGGSAKTNIYGALLAGHQSIDEISTEDMVLGGSAVIAYDFCALKNSQPPQPPSVLSFRELSY